MSQLGRRCRTVLLLATSLHLLACTTLPPPVPGLSITAMHDQHEKLYQAEMARDGKTWAFLVWSRWQAQRYFLTTTTLTGQELFRLRLENGEVEVEASRPEIKGVPLAYFVRDVLWATSKEPQWQQLMAQTNYRYQSDARLRKVFAERQLLWQSQHDDDGWQIDNPIARTRLHLQQLDLEQP